MKDDYELNHGSLSPPAPHGGRRTPETLLQRRGRTPPPPLTALQPPPQPSQLGPLHGPGPRQPTKDDAKNAKAPAAEDDDKAVK